MRSKKSKPSPSRPSQWKVAPTCSEAGLQALAAELARELVPGNRVLLEGPMGSGKSTFARALLESLGIEKATEGSPTFAIVHEYFAPASVVHMDFYRLKSELEIEEAGIPTYFWERDAIVITEWLSGFPVFEANVLRGKCWRVNLAFSADPALRDVEIFKPA